MGGPGSGRWGGRPTVQSTTTIDIREMVRTGAIERGEDILSQMAWRSTVTGEMVQQVVIQARLADIDNRHVRFMHRRDGQTVADYAVDLTGTPQPFGGERLWFVCPRTGDRVANLYLPRNATCFASRAAYRLGYASQRISPRDRAIARMHRLRIALGGEPNPLRPIDKPYRMRQTTFDARMEKVERAEARAMGFAAIATEALHRRIERRAQATV